MMESQNMNLRNTMSIANMTDKTHVKSQNQIYVINSSNPGRNSSIKPSTNPNMQVPRQNAVVKGNHSYTTLKIAERQINGHESYTGTELTLGHVESYSRMASQQMNMNSRDSYKGSTQSNFVTSRPESKQ